MKTNIVKHAEAKTLSAGAGTKARLKWSALLLLLISVALGAGGCEGSYTAYPGYGPYYGGPGPYYGPRYAAYPGSVTVEISELRAAGSLVSARAFCNSRSLSDRASQRQTRKAETQSSCGRIQFRSAR